MSLVRQSSEGALPASKQRPAGRSRGSNGVRVAALAIALIAVYQPTWDAQFIWDDDAHLTAHASIVGPLGLKEVWTTPAGHYFPLVLTTFWVLNKAFGLDPFVFHVFGVTLHVACTFLLWAVLRRLRFPGAGLGAALWGLHPVQVESVAWVSEIVNTQSGVFFLLSIWFGCRWLAPSDGAAARRSDYSLAFACAVCAMLSKPSTVMLPVVLALCAWWLRGRVHWRDVAWLAPFFAIALATSGWAIVEQRVHQRAAGADWDLTLADRVIVAGKAVWFYAGKLVWPHPLSFIYPRWSIESTRWVSWIWPVAVTAGAALLAWKAWWRGGAWRGVLFAVAYHVALLFPVLGFFNVYFFRYSFVADHFQYLSSMGLLALMGAGLAVAGDHIATRVGAIASRTAMIATLVVLAVLSWRHARVFVNDETLWRATLRTNPACVLAHNNLGVLLAESGRMDEAVAHYRQALSLNPRVAESHASLAQALMRSLGGREEAVRHFQIALQLKPELASAHSSYARLLATLDGRRDEAIRHLEAAVRLRPDSAEDHSNLSVLLTNAPGRLADAIVHAETAIRLKPASAESHFNLGKALARTRDGTERAVHHYETAIRLKPDFAKAYIELGLMCASIPGRLDDAIRHYGAALRIDPRSAVAHNNLAIVLAQSGRREDARTHFERALEIDPNYVDARNNLAVLLGTR